MSDNKKWFKVWATILLDPQFRNLSISDVGRWCKLGALMVSQGENGMLILYPPAKAFVFDLECTSFDDAVSALKRLPNVRVEMSQSDNGKTIVIMRNWFKYQVDPTAYERVKRSRYKRRGEEKRSLTSTSTSSATRSAPLAGASATRENERGNKWQVNTKESLNDPDIATPEEVRQIMEKFRKTHPPGGTT